MKPSERQRRVWSIAEKDINYDVWRDMHEQTKEPFFQYINQCPDEIKHMLSGYAASGEMMIQRILNIACELLVFPEEITGQAKE